MDIEEDKKTDNKSPKTKFDLRSKELLIETILQIIALCLVLSVAGLVLFASVFAGIASGNTGMLAMGVVICIVILGICVGAVFNSRKTSLHNRLADKATPYILKFIAYSKDKLTKSK